MRRFVTFYYDYKAGLGWDQIIKAQSCGFKKFPEGSTAPDKSRVQEILSVSGGDGGGGGGGGAIY